MKKMEVKVSELCTASINMYNFSLHVYYRMEVKNKRTDHPFKNFNR